MESVFVFGPDGAQYRWQASGRRLPADISQSLAGDVSVLSPGMLLVQRHFNVKLAAGPVCNCKASGNVNFYGPASVSHETSCPCHPWWDQMAGHTW